MGRHQLTFVNKNEQPKRVVWGSPMKDPEKLVFMYFGEAAQLFRSH